MILDILVQEDVGVPPGTIICYVGKPNEQLTARQNRSANELQAPKNEVAAAISLEEPPANAASSKRIKKLCAFHQLHGK